MDAWEKHHYCMAAPNMLFLTYQLSEEWKAISSWEQHPPSYMLRDPLIQALRIFRLLSALKNKVELHFTS
jgi:hypothetical protein